MSPTSKAVSHNHLCGECLVLSPLLRSNDYSFVESNISAKYSGFSALENISFSREQFN